MAATAADPLLDLAKTDAYSIRGNEAKFGGPLEGYGALPSEGHERLALYRLYHALELWDWFALLGNIAALPSLDHDVDAILDGGRLVRGPG